MALSKIIWEKNDSPYFRPPPLHVKVLKKTDSERVISWEFEGETARPAVTKKNQTAILSDGQTLAKITLFEMFADKVKEGNSYVLRDHVLRGSAPPYSILITPKTKFFRGPTISVSDELMVQAQALLVPPSPVTLLRDCGERQGLMTVEGEVVEVSAIKKVQSGKDSVPLRTLQLKQEGTVAMVSLWRECAILEVSLGDRVTLTHVKLDSKNHVQLQSTTYTKLEKQKAVVTRIQILGAMEKDSAPEITEILLEDGSILDIAGKLFEPYEDSLKDGTLDLLAEVDGKTITKLFS